MAVVSWPAVLPRASRRHGTTASPNIRCNTISHCRCYFAIATQYHITLLHVAVITLPSLYNKPLLLWWWWYHSHHCDVVELSRHLRAEELKRRVFLIKYYLYYLLLIIYSILLYLYSYSYLYYYYYYYYYYYAEQVLRRLLLLLLLLLSLLLFLDIIAILQTRA